MSNINQLELLKELGTFWYNDTSVPQLIERKVLDNYIELNRNNLPDSKQLIKMAKKIQGIFSSLNTVKKESETCSKIIEPLLEILKYVEEKKGQNTWLFDEQRDFYEDDLKFIPDYTLFSNSAQQSKANQFKDLEYYSNVSLILEAKRFGKDLLTKNKIEKGLDDRANDSISTMSPLSQIRRYVRASNTEFGIVTNGNDWILVSKTSRNYLSTYHIKLVDLVQLALATEDTNLLLYWWIPFSREFLLNNNSRDAIEVRDNTLHFTNKLEDDLKQRLTPVVVDLLNNVLSASKNKEYLIENKETLILDVVRFIYQILYIGCLEDRNLLPTNNPTYLYKYSLKELYNQLTKHGLIELSNKDSHYIHDYLNRLIELISSGCNLLGKKGSIGEFAIPQSQFIIPVQLKLNDLVLKDILIRILRSNNSDLQASLRALDTIQFGNIYEHILRLEILFDPKKQNFYIESSKDRVFERSTAVYTPHHIVEQMVADIVTEYQIKNWNDVISMRMIDPCFGSGHFLIELARQFSQKIIDDLEVSEIQLKNYSDASLAEKRQIIQRFLLVNCIYGVDRSGACIDVAKFSIWLSTAMLDQPPLFLDCQLGTGSSLYGETNIELVDKSDLKILDKISTIRYQIKSAFFSYGADYRFKKFLDEKKEIIQSLRDNLSDNFFFLNYGYKMKNEDRLGVAFRQKPFFWILEFPEVFLDGGFSVYATNPPYDQVKSSPNTLKFKSGESELFRLAKMTDLDIADYMNLFDQDKYYAEYQNGFKNLFEGFILLKNKILKKYGFYSLIVPNSILAGAQTDLVRKNIWEDSIKIVREYPEKDSISKRVFKLRKVACAIIFAQKKERESKDVIKIEVFNNANNFEPSMSGEFSYKASLSIDKGNLPLVLLDKWQRLIVDELNKFDSFTLNETDVKEGELNESLNGDAILDIETNGYSPIFGTNRMEFYYFNVFPKQDIVNYCKVSKSNITKSKLADLANTRIAINGIAGANDSRVLCSVILPENTLINSNVNYVLSSKVTNLNIKMEYYSALLNSIVYDKLIRIQKRTNHNSSSMIAMLPIIKFYFEEDLKNKYLTKSEWKLEELTSQNKGKFYISTPFYNWICETFNIVEKIGIFKNDCIQDIIASIYSVSNIDTEKINTIGRKLDSQSLSIPETLLGLGLRGKSAITLKTYLQEKISEISNLKELECTVIALINYNLSLLLFRDTKKVDQFLKHYNIAKPDKYLSIQEIKKKLTKFSFEILDNESYWSKRLNVDSQTLRFE